MLNRSPKWWYFVFVQQMLNHIVEVENFHRTDISVCVCVCAEASTNEQTREEKKISWTKMKSKLFCNLILERVQCAAWRLSGLFLLMDLCSRWSWHFKMATEKKKKTRFSSKYKMFFSGHFYRDVMIKVKKKNKTNLCAQIKKNESISKLQHIHCHGKIVYGKWVHFACSQTSTWFWIEPIFAVVRPRQKGFIYEQRHNQFRLTFPNGSHTFRQSRFTIQMPWARKT